MSKHRKKKTRQLKKQVKAARRRAMFYFGISLLIVSSVQLGPAGHIHGMVQLVPKVLSLVP